MVGGILFLADLVEILFLPSLALGLYKLCCCKAALLSVTDTKVFLFGLVLPSAVLI